MAVATAATAAGVSASQAGLITINLSNNFISATGGNHLNADLTGDGQPDLTITGAFYHHSTIGGPTTFGGNNSRQFFTVSANFNGVHARAYFTGGSGGFGSGSAQLGSQRAIGNAGAPTFPLPVLMGSIPITFTDTNINAGALTNGSLRVTVSAETVEVQLNSFTYNVRSVPDNESSLALLALGAGGILALRRWRAAKGSSQNL